MRFPGRLPIAFLLPNHLPSTIFTLTKVGRMILGPLGKTKGRSAQEQGHGVDAEVGRSLRYLTLELDQAIRKVLRELFDQVSTVG